MEELNYKPFFKHYKLVWTEVLDSWIVIDSDHDDWDIGITFGEIEAFGSYKCEEVFKKIVNSKTEEREEI